MDQLTNTERLLLAQAVFQEGANDWSKVSQIISNHPLIGRPKSYFNPTICSSIYATMMHAAGLDSLGKDNTKPRASVNRQLAEVHYAARVMELRDLILQEETRFKTVLTEIEEIRSGLWDERIKTALGIVSPEPTPEAPPTPEFTEIIEEPTNEIEDVSMIDTEPPQQDEPIIIDDSDATTDEPPVAQQASQVLEEEEVDLHLTPTSVPSSPKSVEEADTAQEQVEVTNEEPVQLVQKEAEPQEPEPQEPKPQESEPREPEPQEPEPQEPEPQEPEPQEPEPQEPEPQETEPQETEPQEAELREAELQSPFTEQDPGEQEAEDDADATEPDQPPSPPAPADDETEQEEIPEVAREEVQEETQEAVASEDEPETGVQTRRGKRKAEAEADPKREKKKSREISEPLEESEPEPAPTKKRRGINPEAASRIFQNVIGLLHGQICQLRNGSIFHGPVKVSDAPDYYEIVRRPIDLKAIKTKIRDGQITSSLEYQRDVYLMFANSMMYNRPDSDLYKMAEEMMLESEQLINQFRQTEGWNQ